MTDPCEGCPHHENVEFRLRSHTERLGAHGEKLDKLDKCLERLTVIEEQNARTLAAVREDLDEVKGQPARRWNAAANVALTVAVTAATNALIQAAQIV